MIYGAGGRGRAGLVVEEDWVVQRLEDREELVCVQSVDIQRLMQLDNLVTI